MDKEIIEGNKLIAEFMGATEQTEYIRQSTIGTTKAPMGKMYFKSDQKFPDYMYTCKIENLKYHSSWDWLMPAAKKLYGVIGQYNNKPDWKEWSQHASSLYHTIAQMDLIPAFKKIVEILKWYNINSTTKQEEK